MNSNFTRIIMRYVITLGVGAGFVFLTLWLNDYSLITETVDKYRLLTDAFSIPGIIFIMVGCLVFVSTDGFFDMTQVESQISDLPNAVCHVVPNSGHDSYLEEPEFVAQKIQEFITKGNC